MLVKKLILSAMGSGLLWAASFAGHAALAAHPELLLLAGQVRLSLGDQEGGLSLMQRAAQQDQAAPAAAVVPASTAPNPVTEAKCPVKVSASRVASHDSHPTSVVRVSIQVPPQDYARQIARRERELVRRQHELKLLSLEQFHWGEQVRVLVQQHVRDLPSLPAAPAEPVRANP